ncbi:MAG: glycosyltransferase family 4 protein, partial [Elusimicrobiota bacterium]
MSPQYKVLHIITKLEFGGAQGNTIWTVTNLNREIFNAKIVSGKGGFLDKEVNPEKIIFLNHLIRRIAPIRDLLGLIEIFKIIKKEHPVIIHTHSSKAGILGRIAAKLARVPVIIHTFHGFGFNSEQSAITRFLFVFLEKICARISDILIFVSNSNIDTANRFGIGNLKQYKLIRSGICLEKYPANPPDAGYRYKKRKELGIPENAKIVISTGNLKPQKNPGDFIKIALKIINETENVYFVYAGGGETLDKVKKQILDLGLSDRCIFTGWRQDVHELLAISEVFVLTSLWEGLPRSLVEALKSGLACVCYKTDGILDLIKEGINGFLVPQKAINEMCEKIKILLN